MINEINVYMGGFDDGRTQSVQQYDVNSRKYLWRLWKRPGAAYQMAEDAVVGVVFDWRGAGPSHEYEAEVIDSSTVLVTVPAAAVLKAGPVDMQLVIHQRGGLLHSPVINFMALRSLKPADKETDEPALLLVALVDDVRQALTDASAATASIENMQVKAVEADAPSAKLETVDGTKVLTLGLARGKQGEAGIGIESVEQLTASTEDYGENRIRIKLTDGSGAVLVVRNGRRGIPGVSPTVNVITIDGGHRIAITDASGTKIFDVMDGGADISDDQISAAVEAYLKENPVEGGVDEEKLTQAVETSLQAAKDSGEFDGVGITDITITEV